MVRLLLDVLVQRIDRLWAKSTQVRDGPRSAGIVEARRLLYRAATALSGAGDP